MAQTERAQENKRANKREQAKQQRSRRASSQAVFDWDQVDWTALICLVKAFTAEDGALRIGLTRDGGALALGCYLGDDYATEYIRPAEDFQAALSEIAQAWLSDQGTAWWETVIQEREKQAR